MESLKPELDERIREAHPDTADGRPGDSERRWSDKRIERSLEIVVTAILAFATLASAWSGYQATRWSGVQSTAFSQAAAGRVDATRAATRAGQLALYDSIVFSQWATAKATGNSALATFEERRFRPEFTTAFDAWLATDPLIDAAAPSSPLVMPEYEIGLEAQSNELEAQATVSFDRGVQANQRADDYVLNTVALAATLFLAGIALRFNWRPVQIMVIGLSVVTLGYGLINIVRYPIY